MKAIGIDLGTTNSAAAVGGHVLPTRAGEQLTPSVVSFVRKRRADSGEIVVGRPAVANAVRDPVNTIFSIKRLMGAVYGEDRVEAVRKRFSYPLADPPPANAEDQGVRVLLGGTPYTPIDVSAMILRQVKFDAEQALGDSVTHAVITVPAYFTERQRDATVKAGEKAGLRVLKIIDEPTAAAIAFGVDRTNERHRVAVFDLGGGTFDVSIIQMVGGQYQVLEIVGDNWLGGDDFDQTIVKRMVEWVRQENGLDVSGDAGFIARAKEEAQKAKIGLSHQESVEILATLVRLADGHAPIDIEMEVTRRELEQDIQPMVDETIDLLLQAMRKQSLTPDDITAVLMVGGSTAVPLVQAAVAGVFGREKVRRQVNPMECVALGAGILAESFDLSGEDAIVTEEGPGVVEVTAMHLGIAAVRGDDADVFVPIIPKGTPYPLTEPRKQVLYPSEDNQRLIRLPVYEGLNDTASLNEPQGEIEFPLPEGIDASTPVEVSFNYDRNRVLTVRVSVVGTAYSTEETLRRDRSGRRRADTKKSLMDDWREDLQPSVRAGKFFRDAYGEYMDSVDRTELDEAISAGERALETSDEGGGRKAVLMLRNKLMGSGTASLLFIAERATQNAPLETGKTLAEACARLREAHKRQDADMIERLSASLKVAVAQVVSQQRSIQSVEDRQGLDGLLRVRGDAT